MGLNIKVSHTVAFTACIVWFFSDAYKAIRIEIAPTTLQDGTSDEVRISCIAENLPVHAEKIMLMRIVKNGYKSPMAFIHNDFKSSHSANTSSQDLKVVGRIDPKPDLSHSYLNVTLRHPTSRDAGVYACDVLCVDQGGMIHIESSSGDLKVDGKRGVMILEGTVNVLMARLTVMNATIQTLMEKDDSNPGIVEKIAALEETAKNQQQQINELARKESVAGILERVTMVEQIVLGQSRRLEECCSEDDAATNVLGRVKNLERSTRNQSLQLRDMCKKDSLKPLNIGLSQVRDVVSQQTVRISSLASKLGYTSAFSAKLARNYTLFLDEVIVFSDDAMVKGQGYDPKTGVFTAPTNGLYAFHLVVIVDCLDCYVTINLKTDNKTLSSLRVDSDPVHHSQCGTSIVRELKTGDQVKAVVASMSRTPAFSANDKLSLFSGYLINAM